MPSPRELDLGHWNEMVGAFHEESDRGAAILAGSFTEHSLGLYLRFRIRDKKIADALFAPLGPLSSFSQRITIAYAFDLISEKKYHDFDLVRRIRNHFAHHPLDSSFETHEIKQLATQLSMFEEISDDQYPNPGQRHRISYLLTCGMLAASLLDAIENETERREKSEGNQDV